MSNKYQRYNQRRQADFYRQVDEKKRKRHEQDAAHRSYEAKLRREEKYREWRHILYTLLGELNIKSTPLEYKHIMYIDDVRIKSISFSTTITIQGKTP